MALPYRPECVDKLDSSTKLFFGYTVVTYTDSEPRKQVGSVQRHLLADRIDFTGLMRQLTVCKTACFLAEKVSWERCSVSPCDPFSKGFLTEMEGPPRTAPEQVFMSAHILVGVGGAINWNRTPETNHKCFICRYLDRF